VPPRSTGAIAQLDGLVGARRAPASTPRGLLRVRAAAASIAARLISSLVAEGWSAERCPTDGTEFLGSAPGPCRNGRVRASAVTNGHRRLRGTAGRWRSSSRSRDDAGGRFRSWSRRPGVQIPSITPRHRFRGAPAAPPVACTQAGLKGRSLGRERRGRRGADCHGTAPFGPRPPPGLVNTSVSAGLPAGSCRAIATATCERVDTAARSRQAFLLQHLAGA
jgi:hypothetical protein